MTATGDGPDKGGQGGFRRRGWRAISLANLARQATGNAVSASAPLQACAVDLRCCLRYENERQGFSQSCMGAER